MRNKLGIEIKRGHWIRGRNISFPDRDESGIVYGVNLHDRIAYVEREGGGQVAMRLDDVTQTLGPMTLEKDGTVKQNPAGARYRSVEVDTRDGGFEYGMDAVTPVAFEFTKLARARKGRAYSWSLPADLIESDDFQSWVKVNKGRVVFTSLNQLKRLMMEFRTVKQNPLTRIKRSEIATKRSQAAGHPAPTERTIKRRKRTAATIIPGVYANPLTRVSVTSDSQRAHISPKTGRPTKRPDARLTRRRTITESLPAGYYANPSARTMSERRALACESMNYVVCGNDMFIAMFTHRPVAVEYMGMLAKAHPTREFFILPLD